MRNNKIISLLVFLGYIVLPLVLLASVLTIVIKRDRNISKTFSSEDAKALEGGTQVKAFPEAEGFGAAETKGGRGGKIYEVTNLNDSGTGSLRECVNATGARICVFKVGGTITLSSTLSITNPFITIAGQTAPGGGITLRKTSGGDIFSFNTNDVIIRYITGRPGPGGENHAVQIAKNNSTSNYNIIFDHCSFSWGVDSVWETWYQSHNVILQWSLATEGLDCSTHSKGCHSKGVMIGGYKLGESSSQKGSYDVTLHHNLMAHNGERTPLMQFCGNGQVINNVTYNPYWTFSHQEINCIDSAAVSTVNWIGNFHKKGPDSTSNSDLKVRRTGGTSTGRAYVQGNIGPSRTNSSLPDSNWVDASTSDMIASAPVSAPSVTTDSCNSTTSCEAADKVLADAGNSKGINCNGNWYDRRDSIDTRVINDVKNGTGRIIDDPSEVGGWANISGGTACDDSDHDGMPNEWETARGLDPNLNDSALDRDGDGYTNIEEYINGAGTYTGPTFTPVPTTPATSPTPTETPTSVPPSPTKTPTLTPSPTRTPTQIPPTPTSTPKPFPTFIVPTSTPTLYPTSTPFPTPTSILPSTIDVIAIQRATYKTYRWWWWSYKRISVTATSSLSPGAKLTLQNYGLLNYSSSNNNYSNSFYVPYIPSFVTVTSDKGGTISYPLTQE